MQGKLYKSTTDVKIAGVCGGIAEYFKIDPTIVRLVTALSIVFVGTGLLAYIVCAIIMPTRPQKTHHNEQQPQERDPHEN